MSSAPKSAPDWFDIYWAENSYKLPLLLRGEATKSLARELLTGMMERMGSVAAAPQTVRTIIAFARIAAILKGAQGVLDSPDPSPDQVADAVQRLVDRGEAVTAPEIRQRADVCTQAILGADNQWPRTVAVFQYEMLAEIAAQLAEHNAKPNPTEKLMSGFMETMVPIMKSMAPPPPPPPGTIIQAGDQYGVVQADGSVLRIDEETAQRLIAEAKERKPH